MDEYMEFRALVEMTWSEEEIQDLTIEALAYMGPEQD